MLQYDDETGEFREVPGKPSDRSRQARWDRRNLRTVSTHLTVEEAEKLKQCCIRMRTTKYHLMRLFLLKVIRAGERSRP